MSLKAFHRFFICAAILLCGWFAVEEFRNYTETGARESLMVGFAVAATAAALIVYFIWFLRKSNKWPTE